MSRKSEPGLLIRSARSLVMDASSMAFAMHPPPHMLITQSGSYQLKYKNFTNFNFKDGDGEASRLLLLFLLLS